MKTLKAIPYQSGYIFVDTEKENWHSGDLISTTNVPIETIKDIDRHYSKQIGYEYLITVVSSRNQYKNCEVRGKIIAQRNLNLEGIPYVGFGKTLIKENGYKCKECGESVSLGRKCKKGCSMKPKNLIIDYITYVGAEEDVERLAIEKFPKAYSGGSFNPNNIYKREIWIDGYKAAQPKKYTEEQVISALIKWQSGEFDHYYEVIQSLQPKIESIEVETELMDVDYAWQLYRDDTQMQFHFHHYDSGLKHFKKEFEHLYQQPITYQKDGKTYLKVTKINYKKDE